MNSNDLLKKGLLKLFNYIFSSGNFPKEWATGEIIPIFKKGDKQLAENYRGITLLSCAGKLFTSILNNRLNEWAEGNDVFCEVQFGFRKERATTDCMFILHGLIEHLFSKSKPLYCSFIDLQRAFDTTNRRALWYKMHVNNVSGRVINVIKNMYSKIKLCVRSSVNNMSLNNLDDASFSSISGVFQGESLLPYLFSLYLNDLELTLQNTKDVGILIEQCLITLILFADDMVIFSQSRKGLQNGIDCLHDYCNKWGLKVNVNKTKCIAFKKGGMIGALDKWTYDGERLETVNHFKYLGFVFGSSGKFRKGIQALYDNGLRSLFSLKTIFHKYLDMTPAVKLRLFNSIVEPRLSYGCEVWGFCEANQIEKLYLGFLKTLLGVKKTTPSAFLYIELGVVPLINLRLIRIMKYWLKILDLNDSNPVKIMYQRLIKDSEETEQVTNWASLLKDTLNKFGFGHIWLQQHVEHKQKFVLDFSQRLKDIFFQNNQGNLDQLSEHRLYKVLTPEKGLQRYLSSVPEKFIREAIARLRLGSHNFMIERGRWQHPKIDFNARLCDDCGEIEDEFHVILVCPRFSQMRKKISTRICL